MPIHTVHRHRMNISLSYNLKGIDMVVYQTLRRFTNDVIVDAMLDETRYHEFERSYIDEDHAGQAYLAGWDRRVTCLWDEPGEEDRPPHPQDIYDAQEVIWINHAPGRTNHKELAAAFMIVSIVGNETRYLVC